MAFAVIETGGKQYRVTPGSFVTIEKLEATEGATVTFDKVLMYHTDKEPVIGTPLVAGMQVTATVVSQHRGAKIRVATYKAKKRQRRVIGHRQQLTQVKIMEIGSATKTEKAEKPEKPATAAKAPVKKAAPKKVAEPANTTK